MKFETVKLTRKIVKQRLEDFSQGESNSVGISNALLESKKEEGFRGTK
jgi:hypothetical protein